MYKNYDINTLRLIPVILFIKFMLSKKKPFVPGGKMPEIIAFMKNGRQSHNKGAKKK